MKNVKEKKSKIVLHKHVSKGGSFLKFQFKNNGDCFKGDYLRTEEHEKETTEKVGGKKKTKTEKFSVNIFRNYEGKDISLPNNVQLAEAITEHGKTYYEITAVDKIKVKRGMMWVLDIQFADKYQFGK